MVDGDRGLGSVVMEVTDRIEAEAKLRESETKLLEAQKLANMGNWEINIFNKQFNLGTARAIWSAEMYAIYGLDSQQPVPTFDELIQFHPPEDQKIIRDVFNLIADDYLDNRDLLVMMLEPNICIASRKCIRWLEK